MREGCAAHFIRPAGPRKGDTVMVYQDPITMLKEEGLAVLINPAMKRDRHEGPDYWNVRFLDAEPGNPQFADRWVARNTPVRPKEARCV